MAYSVFDCQGSQGVIIEKVIHYQTLFPYGQSFDSMTEHCNFMFFLDRLLCVILSSYIICAIIVKRYFFIFSLPAFEITFLISFTRIRFVNCLGTRYGSTIFKTEFFFAFAHSERPPKINLRFKPQKVWKIFLYSLYLKANVM